MNFAIKEVDYNNDDFKFLCKKLDDFQNELFPERKNLDMTALAGLEKLKKVILIYDGDKVVASGGLKPVNRECAELARMYTDESYRGQGLAKIIIKEIINYAKNSGYKKVILDTWKDSESARKLYQSLGFKEREAFDKETFKNSFSTYDETIQEKIQDKLVFMEIDI